jgi:hypothetical protein
MTAWTGNASNCERWRATSLASAVRLYSLHKFHQMYVGNWMQCEAFDAHMAKRCNPAGMIGVDKVLHRAILTTRIA